jgi:hypothetical protein
MAALENNGARRDDKEVLIARDLTIPAHVCQSRSSFFVMAGLVPAIHVFLVSLPQRRGCLGLRRAEGASAPQAG